MTPTRDQVLAYLDWKDRTDAAVAHEVRSICAASPLVATPEPWSFELSPADVLQLRRFNEAHELQQLRDKMRGALTITEAVLPEHDEAECAKGLCSAEWPVSHHLFEPCYCKCHMQAVPEPLRTMVAEPETSKPSPKIDMPINPRYGLLAVAISLVIYGLIAGAIMTVRALWH